MTLLTGGLDAMQPRNQCAQLDALSWFVRSGRRDMSYWRRGDTQFGARMRYYTLWPRTMALCGDVTMPMDLFGQCGESSLSGRWSPVQRASRGNGATKFIRGVCKDSGGNTVSGAVVQGFLTATDTFVNETACDSFGNYELGTPYPGVAHYLVAYRAGSPDIAGTTVNTLTPTNRDGT